MLQFGLGLTGFGFARLGQFHPATSVVEFNGNESFSLGTLSLSKSYSMLVASPLTRTFPRLSGLVVPPISVSSQS